MVTCLMTSKIFASSFSISPDKIINTNFKSSVIELQIINPNNYETILSVEPVFIEDVYGDEMKLLEMDEQSKSHILFDNNVYLAPNESVTVSFKLSNKFNTAFNFGLLFTENINISNANTNVAGRILIPVINSGSGRILGIEDSNIFNLLSRNIFFNNTIDFQIETSNPSTENIIPLGTVSVSNQLGIINDKTQDINTNKKIVLSDTKRTMAEKIELNGFNFGIVKLKVDILYGSENNVATLEKYVVVIPYYIIAVPFIMLIIRQIYKRFQKSK